MEIDIRKLQVEMARKEMNVQDLASKAGLSFSVIAKYVRGCTRPSTKSIGKIARALGVDVTEIIEDERMVRNEKTDSRA